MFKKSELLDCTLRDGGYYTNWDFDKSLVDEYIEVMNRLPIDYLELGYRNPVDKSYMGKYGYCPSYELEDIRSKSKKKLAVMVNEKSVKPEDMDAILGPVKGCVDMIRIAVNPENLDSAITLAETIKTMGFEVGFNTMYMSKWKEIEGFYEKLEGVNGIVKIFNMVDSFGGVTPTDVSESIKELRKHINCMIGFHGHNNLQLGLINTLTAIENGIDSVDATILGIGRGAGNLNMELLLTFLNKDGLDVDFNVLGDIISAFEPLHEKYRWGTNLPYMLSGANSFPQKDVMSWVTNRVYSFNSIVRALDNRRQHQVDNEKYPVFEAKKYKDVIIVGGGNEAKVHAEGIKHFLEVHPSIALIHATARNAKAYEGVNVPQYFCIMGNEAKRLKRNVNVEDFKNSVILAPYPRVMGTDVPEFAKKNTFELKEITFTKDYMDSCTTLALQAALDTVSYMNPKHVYVIGYDGYPGSVLSEKEVALTTENKILFTNFQNNTGREVISLTPTLYNGLKSESVYQNI